MLLIFMMGIIIICFFICLKIDKEEKKHKEQKKNYRDTNLVSFIVFCLMFKSFTYINKLSTEYGYHLNTNIDS